MEQINKDNYEVYFLDFVEGNLSAAEIDMLNGFLASHPELESELKEFQALSLTDLPIENKELKDSLKREESTGLLESEYLMIAQVEGEISADEKEQLSALVATQPQLLEELAFFHKTKLAPESTLIFDDKKSLLQNEKGKIVWWSYAAAAAAIFIFVLFWPSTQQQKYYPQSLAFNEIISTDLEKEVYAFVERNNLDELNLPQPSPLKKSVAKSSMPINNKLAVSPNPEKNSTKPLDEPIKVPSPTVVEPGDSEFANEEQNEPHIPADTASYEDLASANAEEEFKPIGEFAKDKIKSELLRGKTFSETLLEELAELAEEKIDLETKRNQEGKVKQFSFNIGKFSYSRNR